MNVSQATRPVGSCLRTSSRTASEIWSHTLSGCPSVTDSDVNTNRLAMVIPFLMGNYRVLKREQNIIFDAEESSGKIKASQAALSGSCWRAERLRTSRIIRWDF